MNDNNLKYEANRQNIYRATSNLNTAIENPEVNISGAVGINIQNSDSDLNNDYNRQSIANNSYNVPDNQFVDVKQEVSSFLQNNIKLDDELNNNNQINIENVVSDNRVNDINLSNNKINYEPTLNKKKKPSSGLMLSNEVKMMAVIIFVLLIFLFIIPYIYDILSKLELVITS